MTHKDTFTVEFQVGAAREFADVLLNVATTAKSGEREWLLWAVGRLAAAMEADASGPEGHSA